LVNAARRDLTAAVDTQLKDSPALSMALPLVGAGVIRSGANVILGATMDQAHPFVDDKPPAHWFTSESDSVSLDSTMTVGQHTANIRRAGIAVRVSRVLQLQSDIASRIDRLLNQLGRDLVDYGALQGAGTEEPVGLLNNSDVPSVSGATMNYPGLSAMEASVVAADADDGFLTWFSGTTTRQTLRPRELTTGSGSIWPGRELLGHAAITTSKMSADALLLGDFRNVDLVLFGGGVEVLVDPFSNFKDGRVVFQLAVGMDVIVNYPGAFAKATSVT
jgi:HK97 family phage major capsid protein